MNTPGTIGAYPAPDRPSTPPELYTAAVERLECLVARLKACKCPTHPYIGLEAVAALQGACRTILTMVTRLETEEGGP